MVPQLPSALVVRGLAPAVRRGGGAARTGAGAGGDWSVKSVRPAQHHSDRHERHVESDESGGGGRAAPKTRGGRGAGPPPTPHGENAHNTGGARGGGRRDTRPQAPP